MRPPGLETGWLYEILEPHVHELVGVGGEGESGSEEGRLDAFGLAEQPLRAAAGRRYQAEPGEADDRPGALGGQHRIAPRRDVPDQ